MLMPNAIRKASRTSDGPPRRLSSLSTLRMPDTLTPFGLPVHASRPQQKTGAVRPMAILR